jgi:thioredoxin reductase
MPNSNHPDALILGAGPYGLAAASHLHERHASVRVLGTPMGGWSEHMPSGMFLKSTALDSSIGAPRAGFSIADFCAQQGITPYDEGGGERPIPIAEFIAYGQWYQEQLVPEVEPARVCTIGGVPGDFRVEVSSGETITTPNVVMAAGAAPFAYVPPQLGVAELPDTLVSHASDHAELTSFGGRTVAVLGAGQSALESAVLLEEAGARVHLVVRGEHIRWGGLPRIGDPTLLERLRMPPAPLGAGWPHLLLTRYAGAFRHLPAGLRLAAVKHVLGPFGAWWLHERFSPKIDVRLGRRIVGTQIRGDQVELTLGGSGATDQLVVDHVIAATGYRVQVGSLDFLNPTLQRAVATVRGYPVLSANFESSVRGLYFIGLAGAGAFGPMLRFVYGSRFAGQRVAAGVAPRGGKRPGALPKRVDPLADARH